MSLIDLRLKLQKNGYHPIPCRGKRPTIDGWQAVRSANLDEMARWSGSNTGLRTAETSTFDFDITAQEIADGAERIMRDWLEDRGTILVRFGNAPKRAIPLRTATPFSKITVHLEDAHGEQHRIEVLGDGQQFIAFGQHPDTGKDYTLAGGYSPENIPQADLPEIDETEARGLLDYLVEALCQQFNLRRVDGPKTNGDGRRHADTDEPLGRVNITAELADMLPNGADVNRVQCRVIPSLIRDGVNLNDIVAHVVEATMQMAFEHGLPWTAAEETKAVRARVKATLKNLFMAEYDYTTGTIPAWLSGDWHAVWSDVLIDGRRPDIGLNPSGFYVRGWKPKTAEAKNEVRSEHTADATETEPRKYRFKLVPFADLRPGVEPLYLVDELIPIAGLVDVWGKAKCFKSFWTLDLMLHVAMGWEYRDRYVHQGAVVYCAFEGAHGYKKRVEALRRHYALEGDAQVPLYVMPGQANLIAEHRLLIRDIEGQLGDVKPAAVVLDTLNKSLVGSENKDIDMGAYVRAAEAIRDRFGCVVIIVHHCGYDDTRPRGHSSLPGAVDAQLAVTRQEEIMTVTVEMMRDGPEDTQVVSAVQTIEVGQDANGKILTSLAVVSSDANPANAHKDWPRGLAVFHAAMKDALAQHGEAFQPEPGVVPVRAVNQWRVRDKFYATYADATADDEEDATRRQNKLRQAFGRAMSDAQGRGLIKLRRTEGEPTMVWFPARDA